MDNIEFRQREFDGKWMKMVRHKDFHNRYSYKNDKGYQVNIIPDIWVIEGIYDLYMEIE